MDVFNLLFLQNTKKKSKNSTKQTWNGVISKPNFFGLRVNSGRSGVNCAHYINWFINQKWRVSHRNMRHRRANHWTWTSKNFVYQKIKKIILKKICLEKKFHLEKKFFPIGKKINLKKNSTWKKNSSWKKVSSWKTILLEKKFNLKKKFHLEKIFILKTNFHLEQENHLEKKRKLKINFHLKIFPLNFTWWVA